MIANMGMVAVPPAASPPDAVYSDAEKLQNFLFERRIECPIKAVQGRLYVRISAHVYNRLADYETLADAVLQYDYTHMSL
jgi:hypothetical protein